MRPDLRDPRLALLALALLALIAACLAPKLTIPRPSFDFLAIVEK